jgi:hypothetical protein
MSYLDDLFSAAQDTYSNPEYIGATISASLTVNPNSNNLAQNPSTPSPVKFGWALLQYTPGKFVQVGRFNWVDVPPYFEGAAYVYVNTFEGFEAVEPGQPGSIGTSSGSTGWMGLSINAPSLLERGANYSVTISGMEEGPGVRFVPQIDPTTNVVYGAADTDFIVISLSGPTGVPQPPH